MKKYWGFYLKLFEFLEVKSSICLNRHVFVMSITGGFGLSLFAYALAPFLHCAAEMWLAT